MGLQKFWKNILKATHNLEFLAVLVFPDSSITLDTRMSNLDICVSKLDIRMSRLDIRVSVPTILVLCLFPWILEWLCNWLDWIEILSRLNQTTIYVSLSSFDSRFNVQLKIFHALMQADIHFIVYDCLSFVINHSFDNSLITVWFLWLLRITGWFMTTYIFRFCRISSYVVLHWNILMCV